MWACEDCGEVFTAPDEERHIEDLDGENGIWEYVLFTCPRCGSEYIEEMEVAECSAKPLTK